MINRDGSRASYLLRNHPLRLPFPVPPFYPPRGSPQEPSSIRPLAKIKDREITLRTLSFSLLRPFLYHHPRALSLFLSILLSLHFFKYLRLNFVTERKVYECRLEKRLNSNFSAERVYAVVTVLYAWKGKKKEKRNENDGLTKHRMAADWHKVSERCTNQVRKELVNRSGVAASRPVE